jgi:hypothetical protein
MNNTTVDYRNSYRDNVLLPRITGMVFGKIEYVRTARNAASVFVRQDIGTLKDKTPKLLKLFENFRIVHVHYCSYHLLLSLSYVITYANNKAFRISYIYDA